MKLDFLTTPAAWTRSARQAQTQADYACAVEHHRLGTPTERIAGVMLAVVIGILLAASLIHWWAGQ